MTAQRSGQTFTFEAMRVLVIAGLLLALLRAAGSIMTVLLFGTFLSSLAYPTYERLVRRRMPPWLALTLVMSGFVLFLLIIALIIYEAGARLADELPSHAAAFQAATNSVLDFLDRNGLQSQLTQYARSIDPSQFEGVAVTILKDVGDLLNIFLISLLWVLFLLPSVDGLRKVVAKHAESHPAVASIPLVAKASIGYFRLRLRLSLLLGVGLTLLFFLFGIPYPPLWGALAIFLTFIPYIGLFLAVVAPLLLVFSIHGIVSAGLLLVVVVALNLIIENLLQPLWAQHTFRISAAVSFFAVVLWSFIFGFAGSILAIPITVVLASMLMLDPETQWLGDLLAGVPQTEEESQSLTLGSK